MSLLHRTRLFLVIVVLQFASVAVMADDRVARREAMRAAGDVTASPPVAVVDGTPRQRASAATLAPDVPTYDRARPITDLRRRMPTSLGTIIGDQGMAGQYGGDDVAIATVADAGQSILQIANDGTLFVAIGNTTEINVYRSADGGDTWTHWSTFDDIAAANFYLSSFVVAEGTVNRALIGYTLFVAGSGNQARVAYADPAAPVPAWTIVLAFAEPGVGFVGVDLDTDEEDFASYFVYAAGVGNDADGTDIWFTRSLDQGASYATEYRIVNNTAGLIVLFGGQSVRYGAGDWIQVCYEQGLSGGSPLTDGLHHKRAPNWAGGGAPSWEAQETLNPNGDSVGARNMGFEASLVDGTVISLDFTRVRYSTDFGATWPIGNAAFLPIPFSNDQASPLLIAASGDVTVLAGLIGGCTLCLDAMLLLRSNTADLATWTPQYESRLSVHPAAPTHITHRPSLAADPSRGGRMAAVWWIDDPVDDANDMVRFDAEWRRDPGYANTEVGFPIDIAGGGQTPPAVAEVDGTAGQEIVFGTVDGNVYVVNHDGSVVPGWPVDIGVMPYDAPVAVGDLIGDGEFTAVVAGNTAGQVYAFDRSGVPFPGWPVNLGTGVEVYVSIGALGAPYLRCVVAVSGTKMALLNYAGENVAPPWADIPFGTYRRPAAIGDIDNDGVTDIVSTAGPNIYFHQLNQVAFTGQQYPGETFGDAPTLADIDGDGDLEIAAPTLNGRMYLMHDDTANVPGWPIDFIPGEPLTSAAMAQILGTFEPELVFADVIGNVHIRYTTGVEQPGFPKDVTAGLIYTPPMLAPVSVDGSNVNIGTIESVGHSYRNISGIVTPGWPRNLPGPVEETFASGDIDNDGRNEIVVLGVSFLTVFDVGIAPVSDPKRHWPMYGYDAQRTGCLDCPETITAVGDTPGAEGALALEVSPNPFNPTTLIEYEIATEGPVSLAVYDVAGRQVATLVADEHRAPGRYSLRYHATTASGVYFLKISSGGESAVRKLVLLK